MSLPFRFSGDGDCEDIIEIGAVFDMERGAITPPLPQCPTPPGNPRALAVLARWDWAQE
jgi:hypothetical protein